MIGGQWRAGGSSLYGDYWVDRPPLLVAIFGLAAHLGGVVPLRLIGCLACMLVVLGTAHAARQVAGDAAAAWAALTATALCVSPLFGGTRVNGELLSAPFVVGGISAAVAALRPGGNRRAGGAAALAGAAAACALLVKQNIADVGVFAAVSLVLAHRRREITARHLSAIGVGFCGGTAACLAVAAAWTLLHGTSLTGVYDAMYPFRIQAGRVIAASGAQHAMPRLRVLLVCFAVSGGAVIVALTARALASRRLRETAALALVATLGFDVMSVLLGGNYWQHYLVQLIVPSAILSGVLVARGQPGSKVAVVATAVVAALASAIAVPARGTTTASDVGHAVARVAHAHDTIVTAYGHADVTLTSGLASPYPQLWSLPAKTLDPRQDVLDGVLRGPAAPTWFVTWNHVASWGFSSASTAQLIAQRYHVVARLGGRTVYLHNGLSRPVPQLTSPERSKP